MRKFRIINIALDLDENVETITAVVQAETLDAIKTMVDPTEVKQTPSTQTVGTEVTVTMPWVVAAALFTAVGGLQPTDPRSEHVDPDVYDSLDPVVLGLMAA